MPTKCELHACFLPNVGQKIDKCLFIFFLQGVSGPVGQPGYIGPRGPDGFPVCKLTYVSPPKTHNLSSRPVAYLCFMHLILLGG